ncbi:hypothetical protein [Aeromonas veronii]|uniref:hypothetical protein n=1 Tax=Aeromonas veronii TaxID=654 RepID=UPI003005136A
MNAEQLLSETITFLDARTEPATVSLLEAAPDRVYRIALQGNTFMVKRPTGEIFSLTSQDPKSLFDHLSYSVEKSAGSSEEAKALRYRRTAIQTVVNRHYLTKGVKMCGSFISDKEEDYVFFDGTDLNLLHVDLKGERAKLHVYKGIPDANRAGRWVFSKK